jgi:hypothetical protein
MERVISFEEIERRVLEKFDMNDVGVQYAVKKWREACNKRKKKLSVLEKVHEIISETVIDRIVEFFQLQVERYYFIYRAMLNESKEEALYHEMHFLMLEHEGFRVTEDMILVPDLLAVVRKMEGLTPSDVKQILDSVEDFLNGKEVNWPVFVPDDFISDLDEFVRINGTKLVEDVIHDPDIAENYANNKNAPAPIVSLSRLVLMLEEAKMNDDIDKNRFIGFKAA